MTGIHRNFQKVSIWKNFNLMYLKVIRIEQGKNSTMYEIYLNNEFVHYDLERILREKKIRGMNGND